MVDISLNVFVYLIFPFFNGVQLSNVQMIFPYYVVAIYRFKVFSVE